MSTELITRHVQTMILDARSFYEHGWLMGTSGNLSTRVDEKRFIITGSGKDKGRLSTSDFLACGMDGKAIDEKNPNKPSAETLVHCAIYKRFEHVGAIYHVHDPYAALCSARDKEKEHTSFSGLEMIKGLDIWDPAAIIQVPILPNHAHIPTLATAIKEWLDSDRGRWPVPCVNILRHGVYAWGKSPFEAKRNLETLSYLFKFSWEWSLHQGS